MKLDMTFEESNQRIDMTFAEVQTASDGGFEKGYEQCKKEMDVYFDDINEAINEKTGEEATYKPSEMGDAIRDIVKFEEYATAICFGGVDLPEVVIVNAYNAKTLDNFITPTSTIKELTVNCKKQVTSMNRFIYGTGNNLIKITLNVDTSKCTNFRQAFYHMRGRVVAGYQEYVIIEGEIDFTSATSVSACFDLCNYLKEVRFAKETLSLSISLVSGKYLSDESIQSIIDGLADLTGQTAQKITFHTDVVLKLTDEQWNQINAKNWEVG
jgi:hypothetical protein